MVTRRTLVAAAGGLAAATGGGLLAGGMLRAKAQYEAAVSQVWRHTPGVPGQVAAPLREALRYATLAASSHNTQCWRFALRDASVRILPDLRLRLPVVDPDDHHLYASIGCATENLLVAARAMGFAGEARAAASGPGGLEVVLEKSRPQPSPLFDAIPRRQSTRGPYDGRPLRNEELRLLEAAGTGEGVSVRLLTAAPALESVLAFVVQGNTLQMRDPAFVAELKAWIRFDGAHAARTGDGLFAGSSGNPSLPPWLGRRMFDIAFSEGAENDKYARHVRSCAGIAVFVSEQDDWRHWVQAGRAFQRFALQATALGIRTAHLNQPVEVARLRAPFASALGLGPGRPDLVVRFGRGPEMPRSLRRPLAAALS